MKVIHVLIPTFASKGVSYHRLIKPYEALQKQGDHNVKFINKYQMEPCDYLVFNRVAANTPKEHFEIIDRAKSNGTKIVLDLDDYWSLPEDHHLHNYYVKNRIYELMQETIKLADIVTCTNNELASKVKHDVIHILPNNIDVKEPQWKPKSKTWQNMFGWVASAAHMSDTAPIAALAKAKLQGILRRANLAFCGYNEKSDECKYFFQVMSGNGNHEVYLAPFLPIEKYAENYDEIDVALAPLQDNPFNRCKSDLKIVEAAAKCKPIIVSDVGPYAEWSEDLVYKAANARDFANIARHIINNPKEARDKAKRLHLHVKKNRTMKQSLRILQQIYFT
jgi:glycosyltransferase involved in cell wall biosynthesis